MKPEAHARPMPGGGLDWEAVATLLAQAEPKPLMVFDRLGHIRLVNPAMETLLRQRRKQVLGRRWSELLVQAEGEGRTEELLEQARRGVLRRLECRVYLGAREQLQLSLELSCLGSGSAANVLAVVTQARPVTLSEELARESFRQYEISTHLRDFGTIRAARLERASGEKLVGQRCYRSLHQREKPCEGCPVLSGEAGPWPRSAIFRHMADVPRFVVVNATLVDTDYARVTVQSLPDEVVVQLTRARVRALAEDAGLSERERRVLEMLLMGGELQEIARHLRISARTVRFHQANIQAKLGVSSRTALLRLLF